MELDGFSVIEQAATDVIAAAHASGIREPWRDPSFIDEIIALQRDRQIHSSSQSGEIQFHDRCAVCTAALSAYLGYPVSPFLADELERIRKDGIFQHRVFFIRNLGFIINTEARRITFEEALRFEKIHEETYRALGFELVFIEPAGVLECVSRIKALVNAPVPLQPQGGRTR